MYTLKSIKQKQMNKLKRYPTILSGQIARPLLTTLLLMLTIGFTTVSCSSDGDESATEYSAKREELFTKLKEVAKANPNGYTVDAKTLQPLTSGYVVAVAETQKSFNDEGLYKVVDYVMTHSEINAYGGWLDSSTNCYHYDATMVFADRDDAIAFGKESGQIAIFDLNTMTEITLTSDDHTGTSDGHVWVQLWEGGTKWATMNVGASTIYDMGGIYPWGITTPFVTKSDYDPRTTDIACTTADKAYTAWNSTATDGAWQMPSKADYDALVKNTISFWTDNYNGTGIAGYFFRGKGDYSNAEIFFPAAGYDLSIDKGTYGGYWTSTPWESLPENQAYRLRFKNNETVSIGEDGKTHGHSIRPVFK